MTTSRRVEALRGADSVVYAISCAIPGRTVVKVGTTGNLETRLAELQTGAPYPLDVVWTRPGSFGAETAMHIYLEDRRTLGEWFDVDDVGDLIGFLDEAWLKSGASGDAFEPQGVEGDELDGYWQEYHYGDPVVTEADVRFSLRTDPRTWNHQKPRFVGTSDALCAVCESKPRLQGISKCRACLGVTW